jgi:hypothetical protein
MSDNIKTAIEELKSRIQESAISLDTAEANLLDNAVEEIFRILVDIEIKMDSINSFSNMLLAANALKGHVVADPQLDSTGAVCTILTTEEIDAICKLRDGAALIKATTLSTRGHLFKLSDIGQ